MARIRSIKPDFFRHAELYDAERKAKLPLRIAFAGLWTAADREGRFKWEPRALKLDCLPFDDVDFSKVLDALWEHGFIVKYVVDGVTYGCVPSWKSHQYVNARETPSKIPEPSEDCTCMHVHAPDGREGKGREGKGTDISTRDASVDADFENFKKEYPKRGASNPWQPALQLFRKAVKDGTDPPAIISAAASYRHECEKNNIVNTDKVAQAQTWLRQERFRDYKPVAPVETIPGEFLVKRFSQDQTWRAEYGPEPGKPGCRASPEVLAKYGYEPRAA
jgi:hypothetical protein